MSHKPNFFIIGAAKSGTTSLHDYLSAHPDIFLSDPKEPGFFVPELDYYPGDERWYLGLFARAGSSRYRGESSTHYSKLPVYGGVPERIAGFVDEAPRFVYLMRDPVQRAISHYWHSVRKHEEHRSIDEAVRRGVRYRAFSDYRMQLEPYFDTFGRQCVYALTFEDLVARPRESVAALLEWLDLPPMPAGAALEKKNARPDRIRRVRGRGRLQTFRHSAAWERIAPLAPSWLKRLGRTLSVRDVEPDAEPCRALVEALRLEMRPKVSALEELLGRRFPDWTFTMAEAE